MFLAFSPTGILALHLIEAMGSTYQLGVMMFHLGTITQWDAFCVEIIEGPSRVHQ